MIYQFLRRRPEIIEDINFNFPKLTPDEKDLLTYLKNKFKKGDIIVKAATDIGNNSVNLNDDNKFETFYIKNDKYMFLNLYFDEKCEKPIARLKLSKKDAFFNYYSLLAFIDDYFIETDPVFEIQLLRYKKPSINPDKFNEILDFLRDDSINLFTEMISFYKSKGENVKNISPDFTDNLDTLSSTKIRDILQRIEYIIFNNQAERQDFWTWFLQKYINSILPILQFRLLGTYWTDLAVQGNGNNYRYNRDPEVMAAFEIRNQAAYDVTYRQLIDCLDIKNMQRGDVFKEIGAKIESRNLKNPALRPYIILRYNQNNTILQPLKMILIKKILNFYKNLAKKYKVATMKTSLIGNILGFNFYFDTTSDLNRTQDLPAEEGDLKAIYDKQFNPHLENLKYPEYYGINYMIRKIVVKEFNSEEEYKSWNKLP